MSRMDKTSSSYGLSPVKLSRLIKGHNIKMEDLDFSSLDESKGEISKTNIPSTSKGFSLKDFGISNSEFKPANQVSDIDLKPHFANETFLNAEEKFEGQTIDSYFQTRSETIPSMDFEDMRRGSLTRPSITRPYNNNSRRETLPVASTSNSRRETLPRTTNAFSSILNDISCADNTLEMYEKFKRKKTQNREPKLQNETFDMIDFSPSSNSTHLSDLSEASSENKSNSENTPIVRRQSQRIKSRASFPCSSHRDSKELEIQEKQLKIKKLQLELSHTVKRNSLEIELLKQQIKNEKQMCHDLLKRPNN